MEFVEQLFFKRLESYQQEIDYARRTETLMINVSMAVFGAIVYFIFAQLASLPILQFLASIFLAVIIGYIGLYVARCNEIEQANALYIKKLCKDQSFPNYEFKIYGYEKRSGYGREMTFNVYFLLVLSSLIISFYTFMHLLLHILNINDSKLFTSSYIFLTELQQSTFLAVACLVFLIIIVLTLLKSVSEFLTYYSTLRDVMLTRVKIEDITEQTLQANKDIKAVLI
jgi:hypothetical protein